MKNTNWFDIDKKGLAQILARKGKEFAVFELVQNAWDEAGVSEVHITLVQDALPNYCLLTVRDNSANGFAKLTDAYTLFAPSSKKANPTQRGRFNFGEKLVLALAKEASIATTTGTVRFNEKGRQRLSKRTDVGSQITVILRMTRDEAAQAVLASARLIPPAGVVTEINKIEIKAPPIKLSFEASLLTETTNVDGELIKSTRKTTVDVYKADADHAAAIYEMGIPVCEIEGKYVFNVNQKVPLTLDREEVLPQFRKQLAVAALNALVDDLDTEDANAGWATEAATSPDAKPEALEAYMTQRFGKNRVSFDPSDPEANKIAISQGFTVVHGGMLSGPAWENVKNAKAILPAGQVTPSAKVWTGEGDPNAIPFKDWITEDKWTDGMRKIADFAGRMAQCVLGRTIAVRICSTPQMIAAASYGPGELTFNKFRLGSTWFEQGISQSVVQLLIHEFGHEFSGDHLSSAYYDALSRIGAKMFQCGKKGEL